VAVSPDGKKVYVTLAKDSAVGVVDVAQHRKIKTISVNNAPAQIYADPLGRYMYVADQGSKDRPGHTLSVIDTASDMVIKTIRTGLMPHGVVASRDGQFVYITNMGDNTVSQMDTKNFTIVNIYAVGELPNGITFVEGKN
jgi:YVTN family beta-propeller protein